MHSWKQDNHSVFCNRLPVTVIRAGSINLYLYRRWPENIIEQDGAKFWLADDGDYDNDDESCKVSGANKNTSSDRQQLTYTLVFDMPFYCLTFYQCIFQHFRWYTIWPFVWPFDSFILLQALRAELRRTRCGFQEGQGDIKHHKTFIKP